MQNLKINSTSTPYWCVVVPVEAYEISTFGEIKDNWLYYRIDNKPQCLKLSKDNEFELLGCITSSGMDEGVREMVGKIHVEEMPSPYNDMSGGFHYDYIDYMNQGDYAGWQGEANSFRNPHPSALSLLTHNQITLTADTKAVVVKQIT